jgi:hypothetical protein
VALSYTIVDLPPVWPGKRTLFPKKAPFKSNWTKDLAALDRELKHLGARKVELALELKRGAMDLRQDGMLKSDARPGRAIILSFLDREGVRHAYPCDTYGWWQDNVHAIAVVLEDLRRAERYGVQSALLRAGFKALPSQTAPTMRAQDAAAVITEGTTYTDREILTDVAIAKTAIRAAIHRTHPDRNDGHRRAYDRVDEARKVLSSHHGVSL